MALARALEPKWIAPQQRERVRTISRAPAVCAVVLALLTGLTAGQMGVLMGNDFGAHTARPSGRAVFLASAYYDAVNAYLSGEETSHLQGLIAADYRGHSGAGDLGEGKGQLLARLAWLAQAFPHLRVRAEVVSTNPDLAVMQVTIKGTGGGAYEGIPIDIQPNPTAIETLLFDGDLLTEQWSQVSWPGQYDLLGSVQASIATGGVLQPRLERIELQAGGRLVLGAGSAHLLLIESGALTIQGTGGPSRTPAYLKGESNVLFARPTPVRLEEGALALAAGYGPYQLENAGSGPTTLLLLRITSGMRDSGQSYALNPEPEQDDAQVARLALSAGSEIENASTSWTLSIGRMTLTQGSSLSAHKIDGAEIVIVESGQLVVAGSHCETKCIATEKGSNQYAPGETLLQETQGFSASDGATVSYAPAGASTSFLIITISRPGAGTPVS